MPLIGQGNSIAKGVLISLIVLTAGASYYYATRSAPPTVNQAVTPATLTVNLQSITSSASLGGETGTFTGTMNYIQLDPACSLSCGAPSYVLIYLTSDNGKNFELRQLSQHYPSGTRVTVVGIVTRPWIPAWGPTSMYQLPVNLSFEGTIYVQSISS